MNRLTGRKEDGHAYVIGCPEFKVPQKANILLQSIADKCADIEDILEDTYDLDRLRELVEADKDGRCFVLQCKPFETVFMLHNGRSEMCTVEGIYFTTRKNYVRLRPIINQRYIGNRSVYYKLDIKSIPKFLIKRSASGEAALAKEEHNE